MHVDKWVEWILPSDVAKDNYTIAVIDTGKTLEIHMLDDTPADIEIIMIFHAPIAYRVTDEICTIKRQWDVLEHNEPSFISGSTWFKIEASSYIQEREGLSLIEKSQLTHFALFSFDYLIDVISATQPTIIRK